jgi:hypothetical protein
MHSIPSNAIHACTIGVRFNDRDRLVGSEVEVASAAYLETGDPKEEEGDKVWYLFNITSQYGVSRIKSVSSMLVLYLRTIGAQSYCTFGMAGETVNKWNSVPGESVVRSHIEGCSLDQRSHSSQQE